jgi:hypothetical protein
MKKTKAKTGKAYRDEGRKWIERVNAATAYEKQWLDDANIAVTAYTNETQGNDGLGRGYDYNIIFANVETIVPAIINSTPIPDIRRRFADNDEAARIVSDVLERSIRFQTDDNKLQIELEASAQDAFLAGRGVVRLRYFSDVVGGEIKGDELEDLLEGEDDDEEDDEGRTGRPDTVDVLEGGGSELPAADGLGANIERVENERLVSEAVSWRDFRHGPAKRWDQLPWVAFRFSVPRENEADEFNSSLISSQLSDAEQSERTGAENDVTGWEIWCKKSKSVYFIDDDGVMLKEVEDPLGLTTGLAGWFPICRPIQPIEVNGRLKPVNPVSIYRKLADEMDELTKRINRLIGQVKVKGWYAGLQKELDNIMHLEDTEFVPLADAEIWAQNGGVDGAIAFWPLEKFVVAIKELYVAREQTKAAIYEITGISDIIRGASKATETLGAQEIKSQWGSLRIQKMQRSIERAARDIFVMMAELIAEKFTLETLQDMTGIPLVPTPEMMQAAQAGDPAAIEAIQKMEKVKALLNSKVASKYRIDVESDSTIRADLTRQKKEVAEFLQGAAAYFQAVAPLVQQGALPADAAVDIFASTARMFNLGKSVEDTLEKMVVDAKKKVAQPQEEKPDPEMVKAQMAQQQAEATAQREADKAMQEFDLRMKEASQKAEIERQKDERAAQRDMVALETAKVNLAIKQAELAERDVAVETDDSGEMKVESRTDKGFQMIAEGQAMSGQQIAAALQGVMQMVQEIQATNQQQTAAIAQIMAAPTEIVRDQTGKAVGARKVM